MLDELVKVISQALVDLDKELEDPLRTRAKLAAALDALDPIGARNRSQSHPEVPMVDLREAFPPTIKKGDVLKKKTAKKKKENARVLSKGR